MTTLSGSLFFATLLASAGAVTVPGHPPDAKTGAICLGPDLSPAPRPNEPVYVKVGKREPVDFYGSQRIAYADLPLDETHLIQWIHQGKPFVSWKIDFRKLGTNMVVVWKAYGTWKMEPIKDGRCTWPIDK